MARLGIYASQKALDTTGNNIANINTEGYTRQGIRQRSLILGGADHYMSSKDARVGCGTIVTGVAQLRDPYLDIRYRNEMSNVGAMDAKLAGLQDIADVLDEVGGGLDGEGVLEAQFNDLMEQMQNLVTEGAGREEYDTLVRSSTKSIVSMFHDYANQLETLRSQQEGKLKQDINEVNGILESIANLNESIRKSNIYGADALEQKDERNLLIDKLSEYVRISVTTEKENLGAGLIVDKLVIKLKGNDTSAGGAEANTATLVDGVYSSQLNLDDTTNYNITLSKLKDKHDRVMETVSDKAQDGTRYTDLANVKAEVKKLNDLEQDKKKATTDYQLYRYEAVTDANGKTTGYQIKYYDVTFSKEVPLRDNTLYGALQSERELLTEQGEFATAAQVNQGGRAYDPHALTKRGYPYYQKALDALANKFAEMMNKANETAENVQFELDGDGNYQLDTGKTITDINAAIAAGNYTIKDANGIDVKANSLADLGYKDANGDPITTDAQLKEQLVKGDRLTDLQIFVLMPTDKGGLGLGKYQDVQGGTLIDDGAGNTGNKITASNIRVSPKWASGEVRIITSREFNAGSTANDNIAHLLSQLMNGEFEFKPGDASTSNDAANQTTAFYKGSLQGMLTNTWELLSNDQKTTSEMLLNYTTSSDELYINRDAVMGVDLNDEAMNMMQFQKSYSAACRFMTTIDEILEKLINNTGRCGL